MSIVADLRKRIRAHEHAYGKKPNCRWATRSEQARNRRYAATRAWELAEKLGVKTMTAHHMIWQVRAKDKGNTRWFGLSPELEATVRTHLENL